MILRGYYEDGSDRGMVYLQDEIGALVKTASPKVEKDYKYYYHSIICWRKFPVIFWSSIS